MGQNSLFLRILEKLNLKKSQKKSNNSCLQFRNLQEKRASARSFTAQSILTFPFKASFCGVVIYEIRVPAWFAMQQLNGVGYVQPKHTKVNIADIFFHMGNSQILRYHMNLSKGNF